jgi:hypothetical protein
MSFYLHRNLFSLLLALCLFASGLSVFGQETGDSSTERDPDKKADSPKTRFFSPGALVFGDVYTVPSHHLPEADEKTSVWIRRVYLTGDFNFSRDIFVRARLEANQDGDFVSNAFTADIKDLFLRWTVGHHRLFFGLSPTPTFELVEELWGYRYLEKTPLDLQGEPSRDWGIGARGPLNQASSINYRIKIGSGADLGRETGEGSKFMGAVSFGQVAKGLLVDFYGDYQRLPGPTDRTTGQVTLHYSLARGRIGGLYFYQDREEDPRLEVASTYGIADLSPKLSLIGRVDRLLTPSPKGNDIDYLPFDPSSKATLFIAGFEWRPCEYFALNPNLETILYDRDDQGNRPKNDLLLRLTFYVHK